MLQNNDVAARDADRAMLQAATEAFLAQGRTIVELGGKQVASPFDAKEAYRTFSVAKAKDPTRPRGTQQRSDALVRAQSMEQAVKGRVRSYRARRDALAATVRGHAEAGTGLTDTAKAMGVTRNYVRRIAHENQITFQSQAH